MIVQVQHHKKLNNAGATLVEILVVIVIMAVMIGGSVLAFSILNSGNVKEASRTSKSTLEKTRTSTMSVVADEWVFVVENVGGSLKNYVNKVYTDADDNTVTEKTEEVILGSKVKAILIADNTEVSIDDGDKLMIKFDASSGSVTSVKINETSYSPTSATVSIKYSSGSRESSVKLYFVSGKVEIE